MTSRDVKKGKMAALTANAGKQFERTIVIHRIRNARKYIATKTIDRNKVRTDIIWKTSIKKSQSESLVKVDKPKFAENLGIWVEMKYFKKTGDKKSAMRRQQRNKKDEEPSVKFI